MSDWISVKDRLPENGKKVLFVCKDLPKVLVGHHIKLGGRGGLFQLFPAINDMSGIDIILMDATHWMPLPNPPEDKP